MHRIILHIDVNSAFVSWLGAKLVKEGKPDIRLVPSVVSGDPSDRRSIVTAASIPAKNLGIRVPEPVSMALRKCPGLFNVACIVAHRIRRDHFRASCVSMFIKYRDFTVAQKQTTLEQPSDVTAIILNAARKMLPEIWDGVTPIRQVCMGVSRLTHESAIQMSLFEDPRMEFYQEWDRQFDEDRARYEDAKMLAYERKK